MNNYAPVSETLFTGISADEATHLPVNCAGRSLVAITLESSGTTSGGNVTIEQARMADRRFPYSGTWSSILVVAASTFSGGAQKVVSIANLPGTFVRVRVSDAITGGGTISAYLDAGGA